MHGTFIYYDCCHIFPLNIIELTLTRHSCMMFDLLFSFKLNRWFFLYNATLLAIINRKALWVVMIQLCLLHGKERLASWFRLKEKDAPG